MTKNYLIRYLLITVVVVVFVGVSCSSRSVKNSSLATSYASSLQKTINDYQYAEATDETKYQLPSNVSQGGESDTNSRDVINRQTFEEVFLHILNDYVDEINANQLFESALSGIDKYYEEHPQETLNESQLVRVSIDTMVDSLDKYSRFLDIQENRMLIDDIKGSFGGIGVEITKHERGLLVKKVRKDGPADKIGMQVSDIIFQADKQELAKISMSRAISILRGKVGSPVEVAVWRETSKSTHSFSIIRDNIIIDSVKVSISGKDKLHIVIPSFNEYTFSQMRKGIQGVSTDYRAIIIDLRDNRGGILEQALFISDYFLPQGSTIISVRGRRKHTLTRRARSSDKTQGLPIVVLVNEYSASASEIVAGALKDNKRATLIGRTTYGKGSIQYKYNLSYGMALKLTTQRYFTPSGDSVDGGIVPHIRVAKEDDEEKQNRQYMNAAINTLNQIILADKKHNIEKQDS